MTKCPFYFASNADEWIAHLIAIDCLIVRNNSWYILDKQDLDLSKIRIIFKNV